MRPLGNSITYGVGDNVSWLQYVEDTLNRRRPGLVRTRNGAVRASSADFAALCYDEIWRGTRPAPPLDVAVVDYSFTSSIGQIAALIDRLRALPKPPVVLGLLYCPHLSRRDQAEACFRKE